MKYSGICLDKLMKTSKKHQWASHFWTHVSHKNYGLAIALEEFYVASKLLYVKIFEKWEKTIFFKHIVLELRIIERRGGNFSLGKAVA